MTWLELLTKVGEGKMPTVKDANTGRTGQVTVIKDNGRHRGIGVQFPGQSWDTWYHEINMGDRRSRYMDALTFAT
jgi:hypothetical protein